MSGVRDLSDRSPDAMPCYLVILDGALGAVHKTLASARAHIEKQDGIVKILSGMPIGEGDGKNYIIRMPYFVETPNADPPSHRRMPTTHATYLDMT